MSSRELRFRIRVFLYLLVKGRNWPWVAWREATAEERLLCCSGYMCGCRAATNFDELAWFMEQDSEWREKG